MIRDYLPIFLVTVIALAAGGAFVFLSTLLGKVRGSQTKGTPYESGVPPEGDARGRFSIKFYIVAVLFILFDVEVIFFFPWAAAFGELGLLGLAGMSIFLLVLIIGLVYEWRKGALDWR